MLHRFAPFLTLIACASAPPAPSTQSEPTWRAEAPGNTDCQRWLERGGDEAVQKVWRLRAARRAFLCAEAEGSDPGEALRIALKLDIGSPFTLTMVERYPSVAGTDAAKKLLIRYVKRSPSLDGAIAIGAAEVLSGSDRRKALIMAADADPTGQRGVRAMLLLVAEIEDEAQKILWLKKALKPHPSVLASFGHAEFAGLSAAAEELAKLCTEAKDEACAAWAQKRHEELER